MSNNSDFRLNGLNPLSYMGVNPRTPVPFYSRPMDPTSTDYANFILGTIWLNTTSEAIWMLVSKSAQVATWVMISTGASGTVIELTGNSGGPILPLAGNINVVGDGTTITVVGNPATHTLTISAVNTGTVSTLTGNSGGAVSPTAGNINVIGDTVGITITGNPGTHTLTASLVGGGQAAQSFPTDSGTALPIAGVLNVLGGTSGRDINTSGSGNTIHVDLKNAITLGDLTPIAAGSPGITMTTGDLVFSGSITSPSTIQMIRWTSFNNRILFFDNNVFIGETAGNTTLTVGVGIFNVGVGPQVLQSLTTGPGNNAFGNAVLQSCTTGSNNLGMGYVSLQALTTGSSNVAIGDSSLTQLLTGSTNIAIGHGAGGSYIGAESNNIIIDNGTGIAVAGESNKTKIAGIRGTTTTNNNAVAVLIDSAGQLGTVSSSIRFKENVNDMGEISSPIMFLRPVTFNYKERSANEIQVGLVAEEVDKVMPNLVAHDNEGEIFSVKYHDLPVLLLNELQKQSKLIADLQDRIAILEKN
jgi:hypothetical protein